MEIFNALAGVITNPMLMLWVLAAAIIGMIVGAIPGLTASAAIAMLLPLTFYMEPLSALAFLYVIGKSGRYGGSIAAILFNTPGTAASAATQIDGYPLAQKGMASKAMKVATLSSVIGDFIGEVLLIFGVGLSGRAAFRKLNQVNENKIIGFIDNSFSANEKIFFNKIVYSPIQIASIDFDLIVNLLSSVIVPTSYIGALSLSAILFNKREALSVTRLRKLSLTIQLFLLELLLNLFTSL